MVHALEREFARLGLGKLLITAYTGVAAAPFGGPTLLRLLNMGLQAKAQAHVRQADQGQAEAARKKFVDECGHEPTSVGGVVIDEVSFIELGVFGHLDMEFRTLLDAVQGEVAAGGMPLLLCGDCHQKPPPGGTPWHQLMVKAKMEEDQNPQTSGATSAKARGLTLLQSARRVVLKRLMRAQGDQTFINFQLAMRRTDAEQPVPEGLLRALRTVSGADVSRDAAWRFTPVGVLSHVERDAINHAQMRAFAKEFDLPLIRWRLELTDDAFSDPAVREALFENELNLWGYFVEGAPVHLLETIKSVRKLVNGSPALLDSLVVTNDADRQLLVAAYAAGYGDGKFVELNAPPEAVNVVVGGTKDAPRLWHEVPLDDLSELLPDYVPGEQVVPLQVSANKEQAECFGIYAAQQGIAQKLGVRQHQYGFAWALTDFKLQGRTLPKLILSICKRSRLPWMTLASFYVLVSRVRELDGLRLLQHDGTGLSAVSQLGTDEYLHGWERGYDEATGEWDGERAARAVHALRSKRDVAKRAAHRTEGDRVLVCVCVW